MVFTQVLYPTGPVSCPIQFVNQTTVLREHLYPADDDSVLLLKLVIINFFIDCRYFGAAKDLPGVRELFEQERKCFAQEHLQSWTKLLGNF